MITVNGEPLDPGLLEESFNRIKTDAETRLKVSCCERDDEFRAEAEEEVIDSVLIAQDVDNNATPPSESEIASQMEKLISEYRKHGASWDMLEKQRDSFREEITADLKMQGYLRDLTARAPELTDADLQAAYEENKKEFAKKQRVHCLHIALFPQNHHDTHALLEHAADVRVRGLAAENFEAFAKDNTEKSDNDIDLGWVDIEDPLHPFEAMVFTMKKGELSPVLSYDQAFHLIKVTDIESAHIPPLEEIHDKIEEIAQNERRKKAINARAQELRKSADIDRNATSG